MTGAPIYLVSACTSGEEFVAAFRRYADKHGLFVPISDPLAIGRRARFAVTLKNGGVMIEGEAEVISSARTASILHGRVGMTLRFLEPDDASKTTLGELERARLAMKPAPPSIPPRPAELPAEPRPVPPSLQGRIDAVNALAECVAIGDPEPPAAGFAAPPKAGPRFVVPSLPAGARPGSSTMPRAMGLGAAPRASTPRASTAPMPIAMANPPEYGDRADRDHRDERAEDAPPAVTPRATPQPEALRTAGERRADSAQLAAAPSVSGFSQTMTAVPPVIRSGPTSDTIVAVAPPEPPRDGTISTTMTAVPMPSTTSGSAPTEVGGILVDPLPSSDPAIAIVAPTAPSDDASARTQVHAGVPLPSELDPGPPILVSERPSVPEIEIAEPTDIAVGPPEPVSAEAPRETRELPPPVTIELPAPEAVEPERSDAVEQQHAGEPVSRPRKTELGFAAVPSRVAMLPSSTVTALTEAAPDASLPADEEPTGDDRVVVDNSAIDVSAPTLTPEPRFQPMIDAPTPSDGWTPPPSDPPLPSDTLRPSDTLPPRAPDIAPSALAFTEGLPFTAPRAAAGPTAGLPSGDWTIARDPEAPDGWSEPFRTITPQHLSDGPPPGFAPIVANAQALVPPHRRPTLRPDEPLIIEPKVQIDPTLIEPLLPMPPDHRLRPMPPDASSQPMPPANPFLDAPASSPGIAGYGVPPPQGAVEAPPMHMMMAVAQSNPFMAQHGQPAMQAGQSPPYAMDPGYSMAPMASLPDTRYSSETMLPVQTGRRRLIIVLASALVAVLVGIVLLLAFGDNHDAATPPVEPPNRPASIAPAPPSPQPPTQSPAPPPAAAPAAPPAAPPAPEHSAAVRGAPPAAVTTRGVAGAPPPNTTRCFAEISSVPAGADIVIDQNVVGTTPQTLPLPCGRPVEIAIRKARLVTATRKITPTPQGAKLKVALAKPTFLVKVSSTPPGATITLNGRSLGVTPTTVKVPAFESSALMIVKDGYATDTELVAPRANGITVHAELRLEGKKPW